MYQFWAEGESVGTKIHRVHRGVVLLKQSDLFLRRISCDVLVCFQTVIDLHER